MKVIDLLNKIANGEEVPKKIKVSCYEFEWEEKGRYYKNTTNSSIQTLLQDWLNNASKLNDEVELIEDGEIDIPNIEELDTHTFDSNIRTITVQNRNKINEIIKMFNQVIKMFNQEIKITRKEKE